MSPNSSTSVEYCIWQIPVVRKYMQILTSYVKKISLLASIISEILSNKTDDKC
jgi:hypothetical protein